MAINRVDYPTNLTDQDDFSAHGELIETRFLDQVHPGQWVVGGDIPQGAAFQVGGVVYRADSDTAISGTASDYVRIVPDGATATAEYVSSLSGVSWSAQYSGYYDVSGNLYLFDEGKALAAGQISAVFGRYLMQQPNGDVQVGRDLSVDGAVSMDGALSVGEALSVDGALSVGGAVSMDGALSVGEALSVGGALSVDGIASSDGGFSGPKLITDVITPVGYVPVSTLRTELINLGVPSDTEVACAGWLYDYDLANYYWPHTIQYRSDSVSFVSALRDTGSGIVLMSTSGASFDLTKNIDYRLSIR